MGIAVDYAWSHPSIAALRAAGASGVLRYLSWLPNGKVIGADEYRQLRAAGLDVVLNWEYAASDWLGGQAKGTAHAAEAVKQARALGYPAGCGIYGSADLDMTSSQWAAGAHAYAVAFRDGIRAGGYRVGVYGPWDVLSWCQALGYDLYWQAGMSTAWSAGRNRNPYPGAHLRQRRTATIGGADCDVSDILVDNYGQAPAAGGTLGRDDMYGLVEAGGKGRALCAGDRVIDNSNWAIVGRAFDAGIPQYTVPSDLYALLVQRMTPDPPTPAATVELTEDQLAAIGAAAATQAATILGSRVEDLEHQVAQLLTARRTAAQQEAELLADGS